MKLKKLASILLTLCLIIAMMPLAVLADDEPDRGWGDSLFVLGIQVTNAISNDVLGDGTGSVKYNRNTKTLTLTNATLDLSKYRNASTDNNYACGINAWSEITINLIGANSIIVSEQSEVYTSKEYVYGIMAEDALTLTGNGSLSINIDKPGTSVLKYYGIDSSRKLTVDGSTLDVTMSVNGTEGGNGISTTYQGFELKNRAKVTVDGGTLTGVYDRSFGKSSVEEGSGLVTRSYNSAFKYYILSESMKDRTLVDSDRPGTNKDSWDKQTDLTTFRYVEFTGGQDRTAGRLLINGREVTESSTVDPGYGYHTGTIEYDKQSNTLTLTGAVLDLKDFRMADGNIVAGIYATGDLNIVLSGSSKIQLTGEGYGEDSTKPKEFINGIECWGTLTITGGASDSLSIELGKNDSNGKLQTCGIDADEGLVVKTTSLNVDVGPYGSCKGMYLWCPIKVQNGAFVTVKASGTSNKGVTGTNDIGNSEVDADSSLEMIAEGGSAFDCWSAGQGLKNAGALINKEYATSEGAWQWDPSSEKWLWEYKYVKFPYTESDYVPVPATDEFTITYDLNGGTLNEKTGKVTEKVTAGTVITLPLPERTGYEFDYWEGSKYNAGDKYTVSEDHTFKAIWKTAKTTDTGSKDKGKSSGVKTGDDSTLYTWIALMAISVLGFACVAIGRKISGRNR